MSNEMPELPEVQLHEQALASIQEEKMRIAEQLIIESASGDHHLGIDELDEQWIAVQNKEREIMIRMVQLQRDGVQQEALDAGQGEFFAK